MDWTRGTLSISTDSSRVDRNLVHEFLSQRSYWAAGIPRDVVERSIERSLCFGVYEGDAQVGFARVVTDYATFAYLADVFVLESHRGRGIATWLMEAVVGYPDLQGLRRWILMTRDAHGLYAKFGFKPLAAPDRIMEIHNPSIYRNGGTRAL